MGLLATETHSVGLKQRNLVIECLRDCQEVDHSWLAGFLTSALSPKTVIWWPGDLKDLKKGSIVFFHDERWSLDANRPLLTEQEIDCCRQAVIITACEARHRLLQESGVKSVFCPYMFWYLHAIPLRRLGLNLEKKTAPKKIFNFLNRRWNPGRYHMLDLIFHTHAPLLDTGYITASTFSLYKNHPRISRDTNYVEFYRPVIDIPIELNCASYNGLNVSPNLKNFVHIADNIPGEICIQIETNPPDDLEKGFAVTEKSMIALVTSQIPIIIGGHNFFLKRWLADQGLDIFDDLIDQSYDKEPDYLVRIKKALEGNMDILLGNAMLPAYQERLRQNQQLVTGAWLEQSLTDLVEQITAFT